ncbi:MAG: DUF370 domain-containing protein [Eubacteriales bacterium]|nr:DUF370 domain-containing protein [Eubacteriales bacterium]
MLLHLGGSWAVNSRRVIGVFDLGGIGACRETRDVLRRALKEKRLERVDAAAPKSMVLIQDTPGNNRIVLSPISASTLRLRLAGNAVVRAFPGDAVPSSVN